MKNHNMKNALDPTTKYRKTQSIIRNGKTGTPEEY